MKNSLIAILLLCTLTTASKATLIQLYNCTGANQCLITISPPNPIVANPNNGLLLSWDEVQNLVLKDDLQVDRVFDDTVDFVERTNTGDFFIKAGTLVSSHYFQWDPGAGSSKTVSATIHLDSQVFAFITSDNNLFNSDEFLGLKGLNYADFRLRGLEKTDITNFNGSDVDIRWKASKPGDWARLITAFSPSVNNLTFQQVPEPNMLMLFVGALLIILKIKRKSIMA